MAAVSGDYRVLARRAWLGWLVLALLAGCRGTVESASPPRSTPPRERPPRQVAQAPRGSTPGTPNLPQARGTVPAGFRFELVTASLEGVRLMAFSPDGRLFATQPDAGRVVVVPIGDGEPYAWATGLDRPHGIAFHGGYLYVAGTTRVVRWPYRNSSRKAPGAPEKIADLPDGGGHSTRTIGFGPDGKMYVSVGSSCNICIESDPRRAAILQFDANGGGERRYASGLRNTVGFTWDSQGQMWGVDNGTDRMGDNYPPEELNRIVDGGFYGWPYAHDDRKADPRFGSRRPDLVRQSLPPAFTFTAHSAPLGITFYNASQFPASYRGSAFVTLHGSWNRSTPSGHKVVRVAFQGGRPVSASDFVTRFGQGRAALARPVGVVVGPDGSLFISDDDGGHIFRVRYMGG